MSSFQLHPQLANDSVLMVQFPYGQLRLINNALVPWFIVVPHDSVQEWYELQPEVQLALMADIQTLSEWIKGELGYEKMNIAAIGNKVSQCHIHVIGRKVGDFCWPDPVWGQAGGESYDEKVLAQWQQALRRRFPKAVDARV